MLRKISETTNKGLNLGINLPDTDNYLDIFKIKIEDDRKTLKFFVSRLNNFTLRSI